MGEDDEKVPHENCTMALFAQRGRGRSINNYNQNIGDNNYNSRKRGFRPTRQGIYNQKGQNMRASNQTKDRFSSSSACQIYNRNKKHCTNASIGGTIHTMPHNNFSKP